MITNVNVKTFRPAQAHLGPRVQKNKRSSFSLPEFHFSPALGVALAAFVFFLAGGIYLLESWSGNVEDNIGQLTVQQQQLNDYQIQLLAERASFVSKTYVVNAAEQLQLFPPVKGQVHKM